MLIQVRGIIETNMEKGMQHFGKEGYRGVTETWNVVQHEVLLKLALEIQCQSCNDSEIVDFIRLTLSILR